MALDLWNSVAYPLHEVVERARAAEQAGWTGISVFDSQNLAADCFAVLTLAATATGRLGLATGVNSPAIRHPSVTAGAIATLQRISGGRAVVGMGRGDSALANIGRAPVRVAAFERYIKALQDYLSGRAVQFDELDFDDRQAATLDNMELGDVPSDSRLAWLRDDDLKVPLDVACSGPKVIAAAARHADRVMLAVGAEPDRIAWGMGRARRARRESGLSEDELKFGAFINLSCHRDVSVARKLVAKNLATYVRFSMMHGTKDNSFSAQSDDQLVNLNRSFDMRAHRNEHLLSHELIDRFAIVGGAEVCIRRLQAIEALGISKVVIVGARDYADPRAIEAEENFAREVLPVFNAY